MTKDDAKPNRTSLVGQIQLAIRFSTSRPIQQRAMWIAQELVDTFGERLGDLVLRPTPTNTFSIHCRSRQIWDLQTDGGLPDAELVKERVREWIDDQEIVTEPFHALPSTKGARRIGDRMSAARL